MRPSYDMNNYPLSKRYARIEECVSLRTAARHTHATRLPFRNMGNRWMLNLLRVGGKVSRTVFTEKYKAFRLSRMNLSM